MGRLADGSAMTGYMCGKSVAGNLQNVMPVPMHNY